MMNQNSFAMICLVLAACGSIDSSGDPTVIGGGDGKVDSAGSIFERVELFDMSLSTELPLDSEQAATAEAAKFLADVEEAHLESCASDLHVARDHVYGRFDSCRTWAQPDGTTWAPAFQCDAGYCALQPLDDAEIVRIDGSAHVGTVSGNTLAPGSNPIVVLDLGKVSALVSSEDFTHGVQLAHGVAAVVPHLFVRTHGGAFTEAPGLPALPHTAGAQFNLGFDPAAMRLALPANADRVELYFRFERWNYTKISGEDASSDARLDSRASDQYASNFGNNYVLPVR